MKKTKENLREELVQLKSEVAKAGYWKKNQIIKRGKLVNLIYEKGGLALS